VAPSAKSRRGLACLTQVRICEPGAPLRLCGKKTVSSVVVAVYLILIFMTMRSGHKASTDPLHCQGDQAGLHDQLVARQ
jgi:hypothetical protein